MSAPLEVTRALLRDNPLLFPAPDSDKEARGRVLVVGGSAQVPGAVRLAGEAALRAGAGKLQLAAPSSIALHIGPLVPEARVFALRETDGEISPEATETILDFMNGCAAVLIGPGMIAKAPAAALTQRLLETAEGPAFVLDAAAMAACRTNPELARRHAGRIVLTPHAGEMAKLSGATREAITADPLKVAHETAEKFGAVVVLKGADTVIAAPDGRLWTHHGETVGLATSGSGDVLAGVITGLLARGAAPEQAALWGVWAHGQAGLRLAQRIGPLGFLARELPGEIPGVLAELA